MSYNMKINTFRGLGDPGANDELHMRLNRKRADITIQKIKEWGIDPYTICDIAGPSTVGKWVADACMARMWGTEGDLDFEWNPVVSHCHTVICLEVIEHVLNPLKLLHEIKSKIIYDRLIVSWPERPHWLWSDHHFHEYDIPRFKYLCYRANMTIMRHHRYRMPMAWWQGFTGIRPAIRQFVSWQHIVELR